MRTWRREAAALLAGIALGCAWQVAVASPGTFAAHPHHARAAPPR